jgi:hypothetical protein
MSNKIWTLVDLVTEECFLQYSMFRLPDKKKPINESRTIQYAKIKVKN